MNQSPKSKLYIPRPGMTKEELRHVLVMAEICRLANEQSKKRLKAGKVKLVPRGGFDYEGIYRGMKA